MDIKDYVTNIVCAICIGKSVTSHSTRFPMHLLNSEDSLDETHKAVVPHAGSLCSYRSQFSISSASGE